MVVANIESLVSAKGWQRVEVDEERRLVRGTWKAGGGGDGGGGCERKVEQSDARGPVWSGVSQECKKVILAPTVVWGDDRSYTAATCR